MPRFSLINQHHHHNSKQHQSEDDRLYTDDEQQRASLSSSSTPASAKKLLVSPTLSYHPLVVHTGTTPLALSPAQTPIIIGANHDSNNTSASSSPKSTMLISPTLSSLHHRRAVLNTVSPRHRRHSSSSLLSTSTYTAFIRSIIRWITEKQYMPYRSLCILCSCLIVILVYYIYTYHPLIYLSPSLSFFSAQTPGITIYSIGHTFPPYHELISNHTPTRHNALLHHYALQSWLTAVHDDTSSILLLMIDQQACNQLHSHSLYQEIPCIIIPSSCYHSGHHQPMISCIFHILHNHTTTPLLAQVEIPVIITASLSTIITSLISHTHSHHHHHASLASPSSLFVLTSHSTDIVLPVPLVESSYIQQQLLYTSDQVWTYLIYAYTQDKVLIQSRLDIEFILYHRNVFDHEHDIIHRETNAQHQLEIPPFLYIKEEQYWREWLLYSVMSRSSIFDQHLHIENDAPADIERVVFIDATNTEQPIIIHPLLSASHAHTTPSPISSSSSPSLSSSALSSAYIYNHLLALASSTRLSYHLGQIRHAPYILRGTCPACSMIPNTFSTLINSLFKRTSPDNYILLIQAYTIHTLYDLSIFLCWAERIHFHHFIIITMDQRIVDILKEHEEYQHLQVLIISEEHRLYNNPTDSTDNADKTADDTNSHEILGVQRLHYEIWRHELMKQLLGYGVNILVADTSIIPISAAIFSHLDRSSTIQSLPSTTSSAPSIDPALFSIQASASSINFVTTVLECQQVAVQSLAINNQSLTQQVAIKTGIFDCLNKVLTTTIQHQSKEQTSSSITYSSLDRRYYAAAKEYFDDMSIQKSGYIPLLIHHPTWMKHKRLEKYQQLQAWGFIDTDTTIISSSTLYTCSIIPHPSSAFTAPHLNDHTLIPLHIRIFTFDRSHALERLLNSLAAVHWTYTAYPPAIPVSAIHLIFTISVDTPLLNDKYATKKPLRDRTLSIAHSWCLNITNILHLDTTLIQQVSCRVIDQTQHLGLIGQWFYAWSETPSSSSFISSSTTYSIANEFNEDFMILLEDDLTVSPIFCHYILHLLIRYYYISIYYDPLLYSISLQAAHSILGETDLIGYGQYSIPTLLLQHNSDITHNDNHESQQPQQNHTAIYYHYQLIGTWGMIAFKQHWQHFLSWLNEQHIDIYIGESSSTTNRTPCVPMLLSNIWWQERKTRIWAAWYIRFAYEHGYYSLYVQHPHTDESVIINHRDKGENFQQDKGPSNDYLYRYEAEEIVDLYSAVNNPHALDLYDFHFRVMKDYDRYSLAYRSQIVPRKLLDPCCTRKDWKTKQKNRPVVAAPIAQPSPKAQSSFLQNLA